MTQIKEMEAQHGRLLDLITNLSQQSDRLGAEIAALEEEPAEYLPQVGALVEVKRHSDVWYPRYFTGKHGTGYKVSEGLQDVAASWEYMRLIPGISYEWNGGPCPLLDGQVAQCLRRDGIVFNLGEDMWFKTLIRSEITHFRILED